MGKKYGKKNMEKRDKKNRKKEKKQFLIIKTNRVYTIKFKQLGTS
jgi:hypothetical protein